MKYFFTMYNLLQVNGFNIVLNSMFPTSTTNALNSNSIPNTQHQQPSIAKAMLRDEFSTKYTMYVH